jgi:predicted solute-binding protein
MAMANPDEALPYIRRHAQEMDDAVLQAHIRTFRERFQPGADPRTGHRAIEKLETMARDAGNLMVGIVYATRREADPFLSKVSCRTAGPLSAF